MKWWKGARPLPSITLWVHVRVDDTGETAFREVWDVNPHAVGAPAAVQFTLPRSPEGTSYVVDLQVGE